MANPNLNSEREFLTAADKEFENNIRPSEIVIFPGRRRSLKT